MSRNMQLPYYAYVRAFLQIDLFLLWKKASSSPLTQWRQISFLWLVMALPRESHSMEIRSKDKSVYENAVTEIQWSYILLLIGSCKY